MLERHQCKQCNAGTHTPKKAARGTCREHCTQQKEREGAKNSRSQRRTPTERPVSYPNEVTGLLPQRSRSNGRWSGVKGASCLKRLMQETGLLVNAKPAHEDRQVHALLLQRRLQPQQYHPVRQRLQHQPLLRRLQQRQRQEPLLAS